MAIMTVLLGFVSNALAAPLEVLFTPDPLFNQPNFLPADEVSGTAVVSNDSGESQTILTEAINIADSDNFGSLLHLVIAEDGGGTFFDDSLENFFTTAGEVSLGALADGVSRTFFYTISFNDTSDNSYQGKTLGFDICVGFEGGTQHCGDTVVSGENNTGGGATITGSGSGAVVLTIFNGNTLEITNPGGLPDTATATITWDTNRYATSQVVYGLASDGPYTLDLDAPNFGYPFGTAEDPTKVLHHIVVLTGLIEGETYVYRMVSRASPATISFEYQFTVATLPPQVVLAAPAPGAPGSVAEGTTDVSPVPGEVISPEAETPPTDLVSGISLAALTFGFENILSVCSLVALLLLFVVYLVWNLGLRRKYEKEMMPRAEVLDRFYLFLGGISIVLALLAFILEQYCVLPVFLAAVAICLLVYAYRKLNA